MDCKRRHTMSTAIIISLDNAVHHIFKLPAVVHSHCLIGVPDNSIKHATQVTFIIHLC